MTPIKTLYWYDGPVLFTALINGQERLITLLDIDPPIFSYLAATPSLDTIDGIINNTIPVFDGFQTGPFFLIEEKQETLLIAEVPFLNPKDLAKPGVLLSL
jgi:hypothetical protein